MVSPIPRLELESLAYRVMRLASRAEEIVNDALAKELCHDMSDYSFLHAVIFPMLKYSDRKNALTKIIKDRYDSATWNRHKANFSGPVQRIQEMRNLLAHSTWNVAESVDSDDGVIVVYEELQAGRFEKDRHKMKTLRVSNLKSAISTGEKAVAGLTDLANHMREVRITSGDISPADRIPIVPTSFEPLDW